MARGIADPAAMAILQSKKRKKISMVEAEAMAEKMYGAEMEMNISILDTYSLNMVLSSPVDLTVKKPRDNFLNLLPRSILIS